ncbi:hypothetical protein [Streptomyces sp. NPDC058394]|uniref:hypothetical protein n=1 Tax=Streptomyces sp. NPDC058394 TaxID=3346477 RepID=UPI00365C34C9
MRIIVRREPVHPKYTKDLKPFETATGFRCTVIATNTAGRQPQWLDARYRSHAHAESGTRRSKTPTLPRLPSFKFALNQAWYTLPATTMDLLAPLQLLALDGRPARAEPATARTDPLNVPAKPAEHARRRELKPDPAPPPPTTSSPHPSAARPRLTTTPPPPRTGRRRPAAPSASGRRRRPRRHAAHRPDPRLPARRTNRLKPDTPAEPLTSTRARE